MEIVELKNIYLKFKKEIKISLLNSQMKTRGKSEFVGRSQKLFPVKNREMVE